MILEVQEDILMDNSRDFFFEFETAIEQGKPDVLSLDLAKVTFIDSSGIGMIIKARNIIHEDNGVTNLYNFSKSLYSVFKLSGLNHILELYSLDEFLTQYPELKGNL